MSTHEPANPSVTTPNGSAMAAALAAGVGSLAMGLIVLAHESRLFVAPSLYAPVGGLSGRSTLAVVVWLAAWALLHHKWRSRDVRGTPVIAWTTLLVVLGLLASFPPVWGLL